MSESLTQEMIKIGDVSFPKPHIGKMERGDVYYLADTTDPLLYYKSFWGDVPTDISTDVRWMNAGILHLSKENAIAHAKALIKLSGGSYE